MPLFLWSVHGGFSWKKKSWLQIYVLLKCILKISLSWLFYSTLIGHVALRNGRAHSPLHLQTQQVVWEITWSYLVAYEWMMLGLKLRIDAEAVLTVLTSRWCIPTFDNINRCSVYCLINQYLCFFIKLFPLSSLINSFWKSLVKFLLLRKTMAYNVYFTHDYYQSTLFIKNLLCMYSYNMMSGGWEISCFAGSCKNCSRLSFPYIVFFPVWAQKWYLLLIYIP